MGDGEKGNGLDRECLESETFRDFLNEWHLHRGETRDAMEKVRSMHSTMSTIQADTKNLTHLETISGTIAEIKRHNFWAMLALLLILGFVVLVVLMKESKLDIETRWFQIRQHHGD